MVALHWWQSFTYLKWWMMKIFKSIFFSHQMSFRHFRLGRIISLLYLTHNILNPKMNSLLSQPDLWKLKLIICCVWACFVLGERANQAPRVCCPLIIHISFILVCGQWPDHSNSNSSEALCSSLWVILVSCSVLHVASLLTCQDKIPSGGQQ